MDNLSMTEVLDEPSTSIEFNEAEWEAILCDGGNSNNNNSGNFDGDGDGDRWHGDGRGDDISAGAAFGAILGMLPGAAAGIGIAEGIYVPSQMKGYAKKHHVAVPPEGSAAWNNLYYAKNVGHGGSELALILGPMFAVIAACMVVGHKIEQRFKN